MKSLLIKDTTREERLDIVRRGLSACGGECENCSGCDEDDEDDEDDDDDRIVEYACPHCGAEMTFEVDNFDFDEDYLCPSCHKPLFPEEDPDEE